MRYLLMLNSFKGTLTSQEANEIVKDLVFYHDPAADIKKITIADGGEGTLEAMSKMIPGFFVMKDVTDLYFQPIKAPLFISQDHSTAVIEMASVAGIGLKRTDMGPDVATTYGVGELMKEACQYGVKKIMIGCGGSATHDGGVGMMAACGVNFYNVKHQSFIPTGQTLKDIASIDFNHIYPGLRDVTCHILTDVSNPLYGEHGASYTYAEQKGADLKMKKMLDEGVMHLADIIIKTTGKDVAEQPYMGAAGGLSYGLHVLSDAQISLGIDAILSYEETRKSIEEADVIITGEGSLDEQSLQGKAVMGIIKHAKDHTKIIALVGQVKGDKKVFMDLGIDEIIETNPDHLPFDLIKDQAKEMMIEAWHNAMRKRG